MKEKASVPCTKVTEHTLTTGSPSFAPIFPTVLLARNPSRTPKPRQTLHGALRLLMAAWPRPVVVAPSRRINNTMSTRNPLIPPTKCPPIPINCRLLDKRLNCRPSASNPIFPRYEKSYCLKPEHIFNLPVIHATYFYRLLFFLCFDPGRSR